MFFLRFNSSKLRTFARCKRENDDDRAILLRTGGTDVPDDLLDVFGGAVVAHAQQDCRRRKACIFTTGKK